MAGHRLALGAALLDEHRPDQVVDGQRVLRTSRRDQSAGAVAPHADAGERAERLRADGKPAHLGVDFPRCAPSGANPCCAVFRDCNKSANQSKGPGLWRRALRKSVARVDLFGGFCRRWPPQRLDEIGEDVVDMLDADRQAHIAVVDAGRELLLGRELRMRGRGGMDRQAARVADIGDVVEQLQRIDERAGRPRAPPLSSKPTSAP